MKRFMLFTLSITFMITSSAIAAWAKPCLITQSPEIYAEMANMDCHKKQQEQTTKHCAGICLCDHAQNSQTPTLQTPYELTKITTSFKRITAHSETGSSLLRPPLLKPPRQRS